MPRMFLKDMKSPVSKIVFFFLLLIGGSPFIQADPDTDKTTVRLEDGRKLAAVRRGEVAFDLQLLSTRNKVIWKKTLGSLSGHSQWQYMYFIRICGDKFSTDINGDGYPEFVIGPFDGGNNPIRDVFIYTVREDKVVFLKSVEHNIMSPEPVYRRLPKDERDGNCK